MALALGLGLWALDCLGSFLRYVDVTQKRRTPVWPRAEKFVEDPKEEDYEDERAQRQAGEPERQR